jgi:hypothetical protein
MRKIENFEEIQETGNSEYKPLPAGGYVAYITKVEDVPEKEYLKFEFDILGGEFADYGVKCLERNGFTPLRFIRSYKDKAAGFFKGFIKCVEQNNPGFVWDWDEKKLLNKHFGVVLGEEEYRKMDGSIGTRLNVARTLPANDILNGKFKIPEKKMLVVTEEPPAFTPAPTDDLPFDL